MPPIRNSAPPPKCCSISPRGRRMWMSGSPPRSTAAKSSSPTASRIPRWSTRAAAAASARPPSSRWNASPAVGSSPISPCWWISTLKPAWRAPAPAIWLNPTAKPAWTTNPSNSTARFTRPTTRWPRASPSASRWWTAAPMWMPSSARSGALSALMFENFWGNPHVTRALERMLAHERLAQTLLFYGPEGVGKATLARRLGARLLGHPEQIEEDDLSLPHNLETVAAREKWSADKRNEDPLLFSTHPDFVTFAPDGPLRQISIQQTRLLKDRAQYLPHKGSRRVFLIDHVDRANDQAANSLLKTLEEPPAHLVLIMTAENAYDLLPTIRSRAVPFHFTPLGREEMREFVLARALDRPDLRIALAAGSPGLAVSIDLDAYFKRRAAMLALLQVAAGLAPFATWVPLSEAIARSRSEKLDLYLKVLYELLRDLLLLQQGAAEIRNQDIRSDLEAM